MNIPPLIQADAEKADRAASKGDWSLHALIARRYPFGTIEREQYSEALRLIGVDRREARRIQGMRDAL